MAGRCIGKRKKRWWLAVASFWLAANASSFLIAACTPSLSLSQRSAKVGEVAMENKLQSTSTADHNCQQVMRITERHLLLNLLTHPFPSSNELTMICDSEFSETKGCNSPPLPLSINLPPLSLSRSPDLRSLPHNSQNKWDLIYQHHGLTHCFYGNKLLLRHICFFLNIFTNYWGKATWASIRIGTVHSPTAAR